jgi:hypothetical protein
VTLIISIMVGDETGVGNSCSSLQPPLRRCNTKKRDEKIRIVFVDSYIVQKPPPESLRPHIALVSLGFPPSM